MIRLPYDLHIHSCLSPCADDDMTPCDIAGLAAVNGLKLAALTDHNSVKNCPAFCAAADAYGLVPVPGMELCTAEEIHLVCLFPALACAMAFGACVEERLLPVKNRPAIFGNEIVTDADGNETGREERLLITAAQLPLAEAASLCRAHGGACFPAHIDREANGILGVLGALPETPAFGTVELHDRARRAEFAARPDVAGRRILVSSDAHRLSDLLDADGAEEIALQADAADPAAVRNALIALLREEKRT